MSERVVVPDIITKKVHEVLRRHEGYPHPDSGDSGRLLILAEAVCETFATALSEHPIVPTDEKIGDSYRNCNGGFGLQADDPESAYANGFRHGANWSQRIFAPEPDVPEAVGLIDCIESLCAYLRINGPSLEEVEAKCEAYRRGLRGK